MLPAQNCKNDRYIVSGILVPKQITNFLGKSYRDRTNTPTFDFPEDVQTIGSESNRKDKN